MPHHEENDFSAPTEVLDFEALLFDMVSLRSRLDCCLEKREFWRELWVEPWHGSERMGDEGGRGDELHFSFWIEEVFAFGCKEEDGSRTTKTLLGIKSLY